MCEKIYITGPESTGKTSLCKALATHYACAWVPEYARQYLTETGGEYDYSDLEAISVGQMEWQNNFERAAKKMLILDTGQEVLHIWSSHKYGKVDESITERLKEQAGALHLLCSPDLTWEPDALRESAHERDILFEKYETLLTKHNLEYGIIEGQGMARVEKAKGLIDQFLA